MAEDHLQLRKDADYRGVLGFKVTVDVREAFHHWHYDAPMECVQGPLECTFQGFRAHGLHLSVHNEGGWKVNCRDFKRRKLCTAGTAGTEHPLDMKNL